MLHLCPIPGSIAFFSAEPLVVRFRCSPGGSFFPLPWMHGVLVCRYFMPCEVGHANADIHVDTKKKKKTFTKYITKYIQKCI